MFFYYILYIDYSEFAKKMIGRLQDLIKESSSILIPNNKGENKETNKKLDIINQIDKEELMIRFKDGLSPAIIEAKELSSLFVIMPIRV